MGNTNKEMVIRRGIINDSVIIFNNRPQLQPHLYLPRNVSHSTWSCQIEELEEASVPLAGEFELDIC